MDSFFQTFSSYISSENTIILAISGGVDSMVILDLVKHIHPKTQIIVAHFDHSLRGAESDGDRDFIANICENENITFEVEKMDIATLAQAEKMSIEMVARKYRYAFLLRVAQKYGAHAILTAHHLDDRIETMLFNLIRGSKLAGITSLAHVSRIENMALIRPLLDVPKSEIYAYAHAHDLTFHEDSTNVDTTYLRNHVRQEILPLFEKINPHYRRSLADFIGYSEEMMTYIDAQIVVWFARQEEQYRSRKNAKSIAFSHVFRIEDFWGESLFFQREILRFLYQEANQGTIGLSEGLIDELLRFILEASNSYGVKVIKNLRLERRGERVYLTANIF